VSACSDPAHHRHLGRRHRAAGLRLVAHQPDGVRRRADESQAALTDDLGEVRVLGQEAVAGVDRVGAGDLRRGHHAVTLR